MNHIRQSNGSKSNFFFHLTGAVSSALLIIILLPVFGFNLVEAQTDQENTVSNVFLDTDLRQAIQDIAVQAGVTIIPGPDVTGLVTAELKEKSVEEALDLVLASTDYEWLKQPDHFLIYSPNPASPIFNRVARTEIVKLAHVKTAQVMDLLPTGYKPFVTADKASDTIMITATNKLLPRMVSAVRNIDVPVRSVPPELQSLDFAKNSQTRLIKLNYAKAEHISELIPDIYKKYVSIGKTTNQITVAAYPDIVDNVVGIIMALDKPPRHVLLDARVVVLDRNDLLDLGVEWGFPSAQAGIRWDDNLETNAIQIGLTTDTAFTNSLNAALNLLKTNREATIISKPQVVAQDAKEAKIRVTTEEYFKITTGTIDYERLELEKIETGTILTITPRISADGTINIDLSAEVSDVISRTGEDDLPVINRRMATSTVRIKDGGTIAIAGLMKSWTNNTEESVPGASEIPGLGHLFKHHDNLDATQQVAIFVTARILPKTRSRWLKPKRRNGNGSRNPCPWLTAMSSESSSRPAIIRGLNEKRCKIGFFSGYPGRRIGSSYARLHQI